MSISNVIVWIFSLLVPCEPVSLSCHSECLQVAFLEYDVSVWSFLWLYPLQAMSAPGYGKGEGSCVLLKWTSSERAFVGGGRNSFPLSLLTILFFGGKAPKTLVWPNLCFFAGTPSLRKVSPASTLIHHVHPVLIDFRAHFGRDYSHLQALEEQRGLLALLPSVLQRDNMAR